MMTRKTNNEASSLLDLHLYVGCECVESVCKNGYLLEHFTAGGLYLKRVAHHGKTYLGKDVPRVVTMQELGQVEAHINSLLERLGLSDHHKPLEIFGY